MITYFPVVDVFSLGGDNYIGGGEFVKQAGNNGTNEVKWNGHDSEETE